MISRVFSFSLARTGFFAAVAGCLSHFSGQAEVQLHPLFTDHAVLQRDKPLRIWGWAAPGEAVKVDFGGKTANTRTGDTGRWSVELPAFPANTSPGTLTVTGSNIVTRQDLLVGDVWLCSGQSNMEWPLSRSFQPAADIEAGTLPNLRLFTVLKNRASRPLDNFGKPAEHFWQKSGPGSVRDFSAVAYYFGRDMQSALHVPIGLINTSWGGSPAEVWMTEGMLRRNHVLDRDILSSWPKQFRDYQRNLANWEGEKAIAEKLKLPFNRPRPSLGWTPAELFNAMVQPLVPYGVAGAIWYQGESNAGRAFEYRSLFADMIRNWREEFGQGDFPFLAVQLAPWDKNRKRSLTEITATPVESDWAELREAQNYAVTTLPHVGIAVITDVGDKDDIHPSKKAPVGARLALLAQRIAHQRPVAAYGPVLRSAIPREGHVNLTFGETAKGLRSLDGGPLTGFAIAGEDRVWHWAEATFQTATTVKVSSPEVPRPVAVRYGWSDYPVVNLADSTGLPASPFRTDDWPMTTSRR